VPYADPEVKKARDRAYGMHPANREKRKQRAREWREFNKERLGEYRLSAYMKWKYGITQDEYQQMVEAQEERCAICGGQDFSPWNRLCIDHCHSTKKVRALLCHSCNVMVGAAKDELKRFLSAAEYLGRFA